MAKPLSAALRAGAAGRGRGAGMGRGAAAGAATAGRGAALGAGAAGAVLAGAAVPATGAAGAGVAAATAAGEGILIVGAAVGLGGRLIRTVSFLGCTLADSEGLGGVAPAGTFGVFSAIKRRHYSMAQARFHPAPCQIHIPPQDATQHQPCPPASGSATGFSDQYRSRRPLSRSPLSRPPRYPPPPLRGARSSRGRAIFTVRGRPCSSLP